MGAARRPKLLPCPFCGNPPAWEASLLADAGGPYVSCPWFVRTGSGDLIGCEEHRYTPEGWNKRIPQVKAWRKE